jgi:hypothetical protein
MTPEPPPIRVAGPAPAPQRCAECSARRPADARFCPDCGTAYGPVAARPTRVRADTGVGAGFRFGIGFFLAAAVFSVVASIVSLLLVGAFAAAITESISGLGSSGSSTFAGAGDAKSAPFHLKGDVKVAWTATATGSGSCGHRADLTRADRPIASEIVVNQSISTPQSGAYKAVGLPEADYVLNVGSTCSWTFRLTPETP